MSAVYNVAPYLEDYFRSLTTQRLNFERNIFLIMVDDGSTDSSAEIVKKWQKRFPRNITYLRKENGGQASARNFGMQQVSTPWITFIDPDDFVAPDYFLLVDKFVSQYSNKDISLINCPYIFYQEKDDNYDGRHPLRYRFNQPEHIFPVAELGDQIQLGVNSAFFRTSLINETCLRFDERVMPYFEDGHFTSLYLLAAPERSHVGYCRGANYIYRKRADKSSTLDGMWQHPGTYFDVIKYGYIDLCEKYQNKKGFVPRWIQRTVLYVLQWQTRIITNKEHICSHLSELQRNRYLRLLEEAFRYIDIDTLDSFDLANAQPIHKTGMAHAFKGMDLPATRAIVRDHDVAKSQILLSYYTGKLSQELITIDDYVAEPAFTKIVRNDFLGRLFIFERRIWVKIPKISAGQIRVHINGREAEILLGVVSYPNGVSIEQVRRHFGKKNPWMPYLGFSKNTWLLMDRDIQADDNAEHLYRWIAKHHGDQPIVYALKRSSHDWDRLKREGFKVIPFGGLRHKAALLTCQHLISSHADHYVVDFFKNSAIRPKSFVFLQHGVIIHDLHAWLNGISIDRIMTSAVPEYDSIAGDCNRYKFTKKEVVLAGLPRHDALLQGQNESERVILIMPTWRRSLVGDIDEGSVRKSNPEFMSSLYANSWSLFLNSAKLLDLSDHYGYRIVFYPHLNIQPYLGQFELPGHIEIVTHATGSIQEWFKKSALLITDYSSVAMDMAYLNRPVIYYQFDEEDIFGGGHTTQKGYFDYRRDGFGPVCTTLEQTLDSLEEVLRREGRPSEVYVKRMEAFFPFRDGKNCERVYKAIVDLNTSDSTGMH